MLKRLRLNRNKKQEPQSLCDFDDVLTDELLTLDSLRIERSASKPCNEEPDVYKKAYASQLAGLAFSGGGIRSATFNLGVIQALARERLLSKFDYLSTVSGGGYIGTWLSAFLHRARNPSQLYSTRPIGEITTKKCEALLKPHPCKTPADKQESWDDVAQLTDKNRSGFDAPSNCGYPPSEHAAVRFLRRYSNYLTPRTGLSGDTLALLSLFLRNLVLMQIALALLIAVLLLGAYVVASWAASYSLQNDAVGFMDLPKLLGFALLILLIAMTASAALVGLYADHATKTKKAVPWRRFALLAIAAFAFVVALNFTQGIDQVAVGMLAVIVLGGSAGLYFFDADDGQPAPHAAFQVNLFVVLPATVSAVLFTLGVSQSPDLDVDQDVLKWILHPAAAYFVVWMIGLTRVKFGKWKERAKHLGAYDIFVVIGSSVLAGALLGLLLWLTAKILSLSDATTAIHPLLVVTFGPPAMLLVFSFAVTVHIFLARRSFTDGHREWWARLGGFILFVAFAWMALFAITLFSSPVLHWLGTGGYALLVTWLSGSGVGAWLAKKPDSASQSQKSEKLQQFLTQLAPSLFLLGLVVLVAHLLLTAMVNVMWPESGFDWPLHENELTPIVTHALQRVSGLEWHELRWLALGIVGAFLLTMRLDINLFSLHTMYRNRLTRAYLGSSSDNAANLDARPSKKRNEHPFTGFARDDDIKLSRLRRQRPIPIINTTMNMTGGDELAWQTRRAVAFAFTPYFCGYQAKRTDGKTLGSYRPTEKFADNITLGTACAVSGAAASPNMGYHTSPSVAALLTAFNLRLGYWAGNVEDDNAWRKASPGIFLQPLIAELTGTASGKATWVNLTDGGHFDNLGIYELIRRRCRLIVATDVGCDPDRELADLANAVRKCWTDFGVHIHFEQDLDELHLSDPQEQLSQSSALVGIIEYPVEDSNKIADYGVLLYLKSTLTPEISKRFPDIRQYADTHDEFPHETTADQFFDENQFEAYRHLGFRIAQAISGQIKASLECLDDPSKPLEEQMVERINARRSV